MKKIITGQVIPINKSNIDTDMIIPKQYLKSIRKTGFGPFLFDSERYTNAGTLDNLNQREINMNFILNKSPFNRGRILIVNDNFGCGSSREHAVWAIKDFGIEAVISTSFADIFYRNSFKNGLLLIRISKEQLVNLFNEIDCTDEYKLTINLLDNKISSSTGLEINYDINAADIERIINGFDDISITLKHKDSIVNYEKKIKKRKPWLYEK